MPTNDPVDLAALDRQRADAIRAAADLHEVDDPGLVEALIVRGVVAEVAGEVIEAFANGRPAKLPDGTTFFPPDFTG